MIFFFLGAAIFQYYFVRIHLALIERVVQGVLDIIFINGWLPQSQDMNPIENLWDGLKKTFHSGPNLLSPIYDYGKKKKKNSEQMTNVVTL